MRDVNAAIEAAMQGFGQGGTLGFGDELGLSNAQTQRDAPIAFGLGEAAGALGWGLAGIRGLRPLARQLQRLGLSERTATIAAASLFGGAHGAAAGYGGSPGSAASQSGMGSMERLQSALPGAAMGATIGGAFVPATRVAADLADNLPAMLGRQRVPVGDGPDTYRQVMPMTGTRNSAPLDLTLRGEGSPQERARLAIQAALSQDEAAALGSTRGQSLFGRFAGPDGRTLRPFSEARGDSLGGLVDAAAMSPGGASRVNSMADELIANAAAMESRNLRVRSRAPNGQGRVTVRRASLSKQDSADLLAAIDDPAAHNSWLGQVTKLTAPQRRSLARQMVARLRAEAGEPDAFRARLRDPNMQQKMMALNIDVQQFNKGRRQVAPDVDQRAQALRARTRGPARPIRNLDDRELARRGRLVDEEALALLEEAMQAQRAYRVPANRDARMFDGAFQRGVRFRPSDYLNADPSLLHGAVFAAQPAAAFAHSLPYMTQDRRQR